MAKDIRIIPASGQINVTGSADFKGTGNTSILFITGSGGVGINTTNPSDDLHVAGTFRATDVTGHRIGDGTDTSKALSILNTGMTAGNTTAISLGRNAANNNQAEITFHLAQTGSTSNRLQLGLYNSNNTLNILGSGNVGIGITNPSYKLQIVDTTSSSHRLFVENLGAGQSSLDLKQTTNHVRIITDSAHPLRIYDQNNSAERVTLNSSGNIGIGTTGPVAKLDINTTTGTAILLRNGDNATGTTNRVQLRFSFQGTDDYSHYIVSRHNSGAAQGNALDFYVGDTTANGSYPTNATHNLTLNGGSVGIGTTSPSHKLTVAGAISASSHVYAETYRSSRPDGDTYVQAVGSSDFVAIGTQVNVDIVKITGNGKVQFTEYGSGNNTGTAAYTLRVDSSGNIIEDPIGAGAVDGLGSANYLTRWQDSDTVTSSSVYETGTNIGIGTTSPDAKLKVVGGADVLNIAGSGSASNTSIFSIDGNNGRLFEVSDDLSDSLFSVNTIAGLPVLEVFADNRIVAGAFNQNDLVISGSRVGIGTATPNKKLTVVGTISGSENIMAANNVYAAGTAGFVFGRSTSEGSYIYRTGNDIRVRANGSDVLTVDGDDNRVGIGTTSPSQKLHIVGGDSDQLLIENSTASGAAKITFKADSTRNAGPFIKSVARGASASDSDLRLGDETGDTVTINGGNVGIGTTSPTSRLYVSIADTNEIAKFEATGTGEGHVRILGTAPVLIADSSNAASGFRIQVTGLDNNSDDLFRVQDGGTTRLNIKKNGNLGIGTTAPSAALHVYDYSNGEVKFQRVTGYTGLLHFGFPSGLPSVRTSGNFAIKASDAWGADLYVSSSGNVGIGLTTPSDKLHVNGTLRIGSTSTFAPGNIFVAHANATSGQIATFRNETGGFIHRIYGDYNDNGTVAEYQVRVGWDGDYVRLGNYSAHNLELATDNTARMTIAGSTGDITIHNDLTVDGIITAKEFHTTFVSASIIYQSGSNKFGDTIDDRHDFTGSLFASGSSHTLRAGARELNILSSGLTVTSNGSTGGDAGGKAATYHFGGAGATLRVGPQYVTDRDYIELAADGANSQVRTTNELLTISNSGGHVILSPSGNVGIGTTNPGVKLDVNDEIRVGYNTYRYLHLIGGISSSLDAPATEAMIGVARENVTGLTGANDTGILMYRSRVSNTSTRSGHAFFTGDPATERVRIAADGNVGIGTTTPVVPLHVEGTINSEALLVSTNAAQTFESGSSTTQGQFYVNMSPGNRTLHIKGESTGTGGVIDGVVFNAMYTNTANTLDMLFRTGTTNTLVLKGNGRVGIGTTSPNEKLEVTGNIRLANSGRLYLWRDNNNNYLDYNNWITSTGATQTIQNTGAGGITFKTLTSARMFISSSGQIKLNDYGSGNFTANSVYRLAVDANGNIIEESLGDGAINGLGASRYMARWVDTDSLTTSSMYEDGNGNIGIGTITPGQLLQVEGNADINGVLYMDYGSIIDDGRFRFGSGNDFSIGYHSTSDTLRIADGNTLTSNVRFTINADGNVGIGTTGPSFTLDLPTGTARFNDIRLNDGRSLSSTAGGSSYVVLSPNDGDIVLNASANTKGIDLQLGAGNVVMSVTGSNVGIGTVLPQAKLQVYQSGSTVLDIQGSQGQLFSVDDSLVGSLMSVNDISGIPILEVFDTDKVVMGQYGSNALVVSGSKVGIGVSTPKSLLSISEGGTTGIEIIPQHSNTRNIIFSYDRANLAYRQLNFDASDFSFNPSGTPKVVIDTTGKVGIGTTSPYSTLNITPASIAWGEGIVVNEASNKNAAIFFRSGSAGGSNYDGTWFFGKGDASTGAALQALRQGLTGGALSRADAVMQLKKNGDATFGFNVGIKTQTPARGLDINSDVIIRDGLVIKYNNDSGEVDTPYAPLLVNGPVAQSITYDEETTTATLVLRGNADNVNLQMGTGGSLVGPYGGWIQASYDNVGASGSEPLLLNPEGGNVGIGKYTSIGARLEVDSNGNLPIIRARYNASYYTDYDSNGIDFVGTGQNFDITDNGTSVLYLQSGGNVGIGTTSPLAKLDVAGAVQIGENSSTPNIAYGLFGYSGVGLGVYSGATAANQGIGFWLNNGSAYEAGRWLSGGNLGIGTTSPDYKLDVAGSVGIDDYVYHNGDSNTYFGFAGNDTFVIGTAGATRLTVSSAGAVTTSGDLTSGGYLQATGFLYHRSHVRVINKAANGWLTWATIVSTGAENVLALNHIGNINAASQTITGDLTVGGKVTAQEFHTEFVSASIIYQSGSTQFGNSSDDQHLFTGFVGIGTDSPTLSPSSPNGGFHVYNDTYIQGRFQSSDSSGGIELIPATGDHWEMQAQTTNRLIFYNRTDDAYRMVITGDGNVGIGLTNPGQKLQVDGNVKADNVISTNFTAGASGFSLEGGDGTVQTYRFDSDRFRFYNGNVGEIFTLLQSGNVGLGTNTPATKLDINGNLKVQTIDNATTDTDRFLVSDSGVVKYRTAVQLKSDLDLESNIHVLPNTGGTGQWVKLGTVSLGQAGNSAFVRIVSNQGYNATATQNFEVHIRFKTSNGSSTNGSGFYGDSTFYSTGINDNISEGDIVWSGSAASNSYDLFVNFATFTGGGSYYVAEAPAGSWTHSGAVGQTVSAVNSATTLVSTERFDLSSPTYVDSNFDTTGQATIAGSVGIGTTSPDAPLTIHNSSDPEIRFGYNASQDHKIVWDSSKVFIHADPENANGSSALGLYVDGTAGLYINDSGDIGIGTTNPVDNYSGGITPQATRLAVVTSTGTSGYIETAHFAAGSDSDNTGAVVRIGHYANDRGMFIKAGRGTSDQAKALLGLRKSDDTDETIMTFVQGGSVGIGTSTPASPLSIQANSGAATIRVIGRSSDSISSIDLLNSAQNAGTYLQSNGSYMRLRADGGFHFAKGATPTTTDNNGFTVNGLNVGIGTTSPGAKLEVEDSGADLIDLTRTSVGTYRLAISGTDRFSIYDVGESSERLSIDASGNVGIGTTNPSYKLHVAGTSYFTGEQVISFTNSKQSMYGGTGYSLIRLYGNSDAVEMQMDAHSSNSGAATIGTYSNSDVFIKTNNTSKMVVKAGGNVGIGSTTPAAKLQVVGSADVVNIEGSGSATNTSIFSIDGNNGRLFEVSDDLSDSLFSVNTIAGLPVLEVFADNRVVAGAFNQNDFVISGSRVGIGVSSPSDKLEVAGVIKSIGGTNNAKHSQIYVNDNYAYYTTNASVVYMNTELQVDTGRIGSYDENLSLETSGTTRITVQNSDGNVGINTGTPGAKLHVNGASIIADGSTAIDPDANDYSVIAGAINDGGGWGVNSGIGGRAAGAGDTWAIGHNGSNLYFGIGDGTNANSLSTFLEVSPARVLKFPQLTAGFLKTDAGGVVSLDTNTYLTAESDTLDSVTDRDATTSNTITVGGVVLPGTHSKTKIELHGTADAHNIGTDSYANTYGPNTWNSGTLMHQFFGASGNIIAQLGVGGTTAGNNTSYFTGDVGIRVTNPTGSLHVNSSAATDLRITGQNNAYGFVLRSPNQSHDYAHFRPKTSGNPAVFRIMPNSVAASAYLEVWGADYEADATNWTRGMFYVDTSGHVRLRGDANGTGAAGNLYLGTDASNSAITVLNAGNVGINTTSPSDRLVVNTDYYGHATNPLKVQADTGDTRSVSAFVGDASIYNTASGTNTVSGSYAGIKLNWYNDNWMVSATRSGGQPTSGFVISKNYSEKFVIDTSGNVGIGEIAPAARLEIKPIDSNNITLRVNNDQTGGGTGEIFQRWGYHTNTDAFYLDLSQTVSTGIVQYCFDMKNNGTAYDNVLVLDRGRVGVGLTSPDYARMTVAASNHQALAVTRNGTNVPALFLGNDGGSIARIAGNNADLQLGRDLSNTFTAYMTLQNDTGNVGIGTTSPDAKLEVYKSGSTVLDIQGSQGQLFSVDDSLVGSLMSVNDISGIPILEVFDTDKVVMGQYGANALVVSGSRVGIGTDTPNWKLDIATANDDALKIYNSLGGSNNGIALAVGSGTPWIDFHGGSLDIKYNTSPGTWNGGANRHVTILSGGNVGINKTSPSRKLEVGGDFEAEAITINNEFTFPTADGTSGQALVTNGNGTVSWGTVSGGSASSIDVTNTTSGAGYRVLFIDDTGTSGETIYVQDGGLEFDPGTSDLNVKGNVVSYATSDGRLKDNLTPIENALDKISQVSGYEFDWNDKQASFTGHDVGIVAQEIEAILPEVVTERDNGYKAVKYEKIVPLLIEGIKEQKDIVEKQQKQIDELKSELKAIRDMLLQKP